MEPAARSVAPVAPFLVDDEALPVSVSDACVAVTDASSTVTDASGGVTYERSCTAGWAFRYGDRVGGADGIFGEEGDLQLLGAFTLEALGLGLDPLKRELVPLPMLLAPSREA